MKLSLSPILLALASVVLPAYAVAQPTVFQLNKNSKSTIVIPQSATLPEQTAARELDDYLTKITGGDFTVQSENIAGNTPVSIYVGNTQFARRSGVDTSSLASEEWRIKTQNGNLILTGGGTRGTLYATYRFLEDNAGVRWWNPWEETVPTPGALQVSQMDKRGKPIFGYRDIYMTYGHDNGRFAIRNRLNRDGDAPISAAYGGSRNYGPPYHVHTFYYILDPKKYFKDHPDWFLVPGGGEPTAHNSQLAMSNPAMRQEFLKLLREIIRKSHTDAKEKGLPLPDVFSVSQEDNRIGFATPADAELLAKNDGAESAILLDFINFLADGIKEEFPGVYVDTLAYYSGEKAPTNIRPRDNVVIRLTDTTSNLILPITDDRNHVFRDNVLAWGKLTKNLRVWDYAITFKYPGLPMPTTHTYPTDLRFLKANNVEGIFVEHEYPVRADMRDFKVWLQCKMFEDPNRDYDALVREFTDGFYGPAGVNVRRYIYALQNEAKRVGEERGYEDISWFVMAKPYNYLSLDFLIRANAMFDEAEQAVRDDGVLLRRVRHARMPLDRFITLFHRRMTTQWKRRGNAAQAMPLDRAKIAGRALETWNEQINMRLPEAQRVAERSLASEQLENWKQLKAMPIPARFRDVSEADIEVYGPGLSRNHANQAKVVPDKASEIDITTRLLLEDTPEAERARYKLPMSWGVYNPVGKKDLISNKINATDIPGPGYHWHKMGEVALTGNDYIYFFWSWVIQLDITDAYDEENPNQQFEIWANLKFEGPDYPHGKPTDKNAISVERVVLVKK